MSSWVFWLLLVASTLSLHPHAYNRIRKQISSDLSEKRENMSSFLLLPSVFLLPFLLSLMFLYKWLNTNNQKNTPPSPPKLPILGNLHQLGKALHHSIHSLSQKYGDLMLLQLGSKPTLIVSSANAAWEIMKTHDIILSNRPKSTTACKLLYNGWDVAFVNYGEYWRQMKSICVMQLLSATRVRSFQAIREEEITRMVQKITRSIPSVENLTEVFVTIANDVLCRAAFGRKYSTEGSSNFTVLLKKFAELLGAMTVRGFVPWLGWIDRLNGLEDKLGEVQREFDVILEQIIEEHLESPNTRANGGTPDKKQKVKDFVDVLLEVERDNAVGFPIGREHIKALILVTSGCSLCASILFMHYQKLKAVIKETLRLHPPAPLLVFRESTQDVKINGYDILARTQVIINAWAIQRDPTFWKEPNEFHPERFLNCAVEFKGQHFELIPFGAGRRRCPGIQFATIGAELVLANLFYAFDWALPHGVKGETLDMTESSGIVIHRRDPLLAVATPYLSI